MPEVAANMMTMLQTMQATQAELSHAQATHAKVCQAQDAHDKTYTKAQEAYTTAETIWNKINRIPPVDWKPKAMIEWLETDKKLSQEAEQTLKAWSSLIIKHMSAFQITLDKVTNQQPALLQVQQPGAPVLLLGKGPFGDSGKSAPRISKPSIMELKHAY